VALAELKRARTGRSTHTGYDERQIKTLIKVLHRRIQRRREGVLEQPRKIRILQPSVHVQDDLLLSSA